MIDNLQIPTLVFLMTCAILLVALAQQLKIPYPIALVLGGLVVGFLPFLEPISIDPKVLLVAVLPPILFYAAFWTSWREFKKNSGPIFSLAIGLVIVTTFIIGLFLKWLFPEFPIALCFAFGAIVSPPDAIAATSVLKRFSLGSKLTSILEGESLINDASALVLYKIAVVALLTGTYTLAEGLVDFFVMTIGGVVIGAITGTLLQTFSRKFLGASVGTLFSFIIPYIAYVSADVLNVSGVLSVVVSGLIGSRIVIAHRSPARRVFAYNSWDIFVILINCFVFILIGSELRVIGEQLSPQQMLIYSGYGIAIFLVMLIVRVIWVISVTYFREGRVTPGAEVVAWSGMRGIVSIAAVLALPLTINYRIEVIFLTYVVVLLSLLIPGLTLPMVIRFLKLNQRSEPCTEDDIRTWLGIAAVNELEHLRNENALNDEEHLFLKNYFTARHRFISSMCFSDIGDSNLEYSRTQVIQAQRQFFIQKWKAGEIDDKVLRKVERMLDLEEAYSARIEIS